MTATPANTLKMEIERHVSVAEQAEAPIGQAATTDADQVHDPVAGRAQLGVARSAARIGMLLLPKNPSRP